MAEKLLSRYKEIPTLETPEDKTVTTLYLGNVVDIDEQALRFVLCNGSASWNDEFDIFLEIISINMEKFVQLLLYRNNHVHSCNLLNVMRLNEQQRNVLIN